jgi:hypothetical protein
MTSTIVLRKKLLFEWLQYGWGRTQQSPFEGQNIHPRMWSAARNMEILQNFIHSFHSSILCH